MNGSLVQGIVSVVLAVFTSGGLVSLLNMRAERRKTDATAEVSLSDGAMRRITAAEAKADAAERKADHAADENARLRRRMLAYELFVDEHSRWDQEAVEENHRLGGALRPPPKLNIAHGDDDG